MRKILLIISLLVLFVTIPTITFATGEPQATNRNFVVVLDAGHGGKDPGALGDAAKEKNITLDIVIKLGELIRRNCQDVDIIYTRKSDVFVELGRRAEIANKAKADLFISVHTNALPKTSRKAVGVQSYTLTLRTASTNLEVEKRENSVIQYEENGEKKYNFHDGSVESSIMFELMQDRDMEGSVEFAKMAQEEMVKTGKRTDMGVLQANLAVLRLTYMPSVLLEVGFISTPSEEQFLMSDHGQDVLAKCIYNAFVRFKAQQTGRMSRLEQVKINPQEYSTPAPQPTENVKEANTELEKNGKKQPEAKDATATIKPNTTATANNDETVFKLQILAATTKLKSNDRQFKGLNADYYEEKGMVKYTYGATTDYSEITKMKKSIADKFPNAFIIAFKNGVKINTNDAIKNWRNKNKK